MIDLTDAQAQQVAKLITLYNSEATDPKQKAFMRCIARAEALTMILKLAGYDYVLSGEATKRKTA